MKEVVIQGTGTRTEPYSSQPTSDTFTYRYPLALTGNDSVMVTARCSIGSSITGRFTMPDPADTGVVPAPSPATLSYSMLWPFHAALMVAGFLCFLVAALLPVYGKRLQGWYRLHTRLSGAGAVLTMIALGIAFAMVSVSGGPNFRVPHAYLGLLIFIVLLLVLGLALYRIHAPGHRNAAVRTIHMWFGRLLIILMAANIIAGLRVTGIL